jgi:hypothetical protein
MRRISFYCEKFIHRRRVFRPQALKQTAIFTTEGTDYTEEKPSADCRASRNNLLIALIFRHFPSVLSVPSVVNLLCLFFVLWLPFLTLHGLLVHKNDSNLCGV